MKKIIKTLSIVMILGLLLIPNIAKAEPTSSYFKNITCGIESIDDFSCTIVAKEKFIPSSDSKLYIYMIREDENISNVKPFIYDSQIIKVVDKTITIYDNHGDFDASASYYFVIELINNEGNGEKIYYFGDWGKQTIDKIEKISKNGDEKKEEVTTSTIKTTTTTKQKTTSSTITMKKTTSTNKTTTKQEITNVVNESNEDSTISTTQENKIESITENKKIDSSILKQIKSQGNKLTLENIEEEKVTYSWTFDGSKIDTTNFNIDLSLTIGKSKNQAKIESLVADKDNTLLLEFAYHGDLPYGTSIKVLVSDKYKNGDKITLYYYNEETKKLEVTVKDIEVKNDYVEFSLEHCSEYVLEKNIDSNNNNNNNNNILPNILTYVSIAVVIALGIVIIYRKKMA